MADISKKYRQHDDRDIYGQVNSRRFPGKKLTKRNCLKSIVDEKNETERGRLAAETLETLEDLYRQLNAN